MDARTLLDAWARRADEDGWAAAAHRFTRSRPILAAYVFDHRLADWRFLLPEPPRGDVLLAGGAVSCAPLLLAESARQVSVPASPAEAALLACRAEEEGCANVAAVGGVPDGERYDLVALMRSAPVRPVLPGRPLRMLLGMAGHVRPGGHLYVEVDLPSAVVPPAVVRAFLRGRGFDRVTFYWPRPGFLGGEMYMQMGDRRLQRYYLGQMFFGTSVPRRAIRAALRAASALGLFEMILPGYVVIARRGPGTGRRSR
ncbi:MAG TPA: hypothetical protein VFR15_13130 [Chloroflexia bacterium]|nr:hypothetical protein [Chloroflexia bacterium]